MLFDLVISNILHKENATSDKVRINRYLTSILSIKIEDVVRTPFDLVNPCVMRSAWTRFRILNQDIVELFGSDKQAD